ncbi:MAG: hypothetical protein L3J70_10490 [Gammaproteobacteria bacterium]|nr:hypothetical protein [Gammaproteobacteria bacterium]
MNKKLIAAVSMCASVYSGTLLANSDEISSQLESVLKSQNVAMSKDSESIEGVMKSMHSESPASMHVKVAMEQMFPVYDMNVSLQEFSFVGVSGDYAIARVKEKIEKISGPASFKSQVNEKIHIFKQEQSQWKLWQAIALDVEYL